MPRLCFRCSGKVFFGDEQLAFGKVWHIRCFSCRNCRKLLDSWTVVPHNSELYCQKCYKFSVHTNQKSTLPAHRQCCCCSVNSETGETWAPDGHLQNVKDTSKSDALGTDLTNINSHGSITSVDEPSCYSDSCRSTTTSQKSVELNITVEDPSNQLNHQPSFNENGSTVQVCLRQGDKNQRICFFHGHTDITETFCPKEPHKIHQRRVSFHKNVIDCCSHKKTTCDVFTMVEDINECVTAMEVPIQVQDNADRLRGGSRCHSCSRDEYGGCSSSNSSSKHVCYTSRSPDCSGRRQSRNESREHFKGSLDTVGGTQPNESCESSSGCDTGQDSVPFISCPTPTSSYRHRETYSPSGMTNVCSQCRSSRPNSRSSVGYEYFGGGLDCRRCGGKVYHAEMQMVSGSPYHTICFSCFCCRKPLETLTYHKSSGEIYCKQCHVRHFGPQGYGYSGALQTPI